VSLVNKEGTKERRYNEHKKAPLHSGCKMSPNRDIRSGKAELKKSYPSRTRSRLGGSLKEKKAEYPATTPIHSVGITTDKGDLGGEALGSTPFVEQSRQGPYAGVNKKESAKSMKREKKTLYGRILAADGLRSRIAQVLFSADSIGFYSKKNFQKSRLSANVYGLPLST